MSIKAFVYIPFISEELLPRITRCFIENGMDCEFDPRFRLPELKEPVKASLMIRVQECPQAQFENIPQLATFEISSKDFAYRAPLAVNPGTNETLKTCKHVIVIRMEAKPTSAIRTGLFFAVFLAKLTNGIVYLPRSDKYLPPDEAFEQISQDVTNYENDLCPEDWSVVPFESWSS